MMDRYIIHQTPEWDINLTIGTTTGRTNHVVTYVGMLSTVPGADAMTVSEIADELFFIFNEDRPADFRGRSLSIGDIVVIRNVTMQLTSRNGWVVI